MVNDVRWSDGLLVNNRLNEITYDPMRSQDEFVMRLIRENSKTVFGRENGFDKIHNLCDYRHFVPITTYDDYIPYVDRIVNGEKNILTVYYTEHFSLKSGYKKLPVSRWEVQMGFDYRLCTSFYIAGCQGLLTDGMTLNLVDNSVERTVTDTTVGNLLGRLLIKRKFDSDQVYVIPVDVANPPDRSDINYLQALFALKQKNISLVMCEQYSYMVDLLRYIEKHWPKLADDIEKGSPYIQPDVTRAKEVRNVMEKHNIGTQLVPSLWPDMHCVIVFDVNNLNANFEMLRTYCGSRVHFIYSGISAPEGTLSTAVKIDDAQTVLIPDGIFYEFKPNEAKDYNYLLTLDKLEIGKSYEVIITNLSGLYRYKTGKIILVVGRYHDTPTVIEIY